MKKSTLNPIEVVLNQIYNEPDLGSPVMNFISPYLATAYSLISTKNISQQFNSNSNSNSSSLLNGNEKNQLESILYKELPVLVDLYIKYPVEYRNTEVLKTGKTLRETLLINLSTLMAKMQEIEKNQYEELNTTTIVKTNLIQNKYSSNNSNFIENVKKNSETQLEKETTELIKTKFDVSNFKKTFNQESLKNLPNVNSESFFKVNKNEIIRLKEGQIEYKVKNKMKAFMAGSYQAYESASKHTKKLIKPIRTNILKTISLSVIVGVTIYGVKSWYDENHQTPEQVSASKIYKDIDKYLLASTLDTRDLNIKLLEKYSKAQPRMHYNLSKDKEIVEITVDLNKEQCKDAIADSKTHLAISNYEYTMNDISIQSSAPLSEDLVGEICSLAQNKTKKSFYTLRRVR